MTPDLDARVAEAHTTWAQADDECRTLSVSEQIAAMVLIRDLHAALKAARGEEVICAKYGLFDRDGACFVVAKTEQDCWQAWHDEVQLNKSQYPFANAKWLAGCKECGYTVRRVLCRIAPDDESAGVDGEYQRVLEKIAENAVAAWHESHDDRDLYEFLGLTGEEASVFVRGRIAPDDGGEG